jgi:predicted Fe-Mo cluster-binding NifX family protein
MLAIPVYQGRVSPLFDVATRVRIIELGRTGRADRGSLLLEGMNAVQRVTLLKRLGVQCLLCAGISGSCASLVRGAGIEVVDGVVGDVEDVMDMVENQDQSQFHVQCVVVKVR